MTLHELQRRLKKFDIRREVVEVIEQTKDAVVELNKDQLNIGQLSNGNFNRDYSWVSVNVYGKRPGPIRLYDTGAFWEGIKITEVNITAFQVWSTDRKTSKLVTEYGPEIFGLTQKSRDAYIRDFFRPELKRRIEQKLGIALL